MPSSWASWPNPFTTRTPPTASSTTPATAAASCCAAHVAGNSRFRLSSEIHHRAGPITSAISVSGSDSQSITTKDITNMTR